MFDIELACSKELSEDETKWYATNHSLPSAQTCNFSAYSLDETLDAG